MQACVLGKRGDESKFPFPFNTHTHTCMGPCMSLYTFMLNFYVNGSTSVHLYINNFLLELDKGTNMSEASQKRGRAMLVAFIMKRLQSPGLIIITSFKFQSNHKM